MNNKTSISNLTITPPAYHALHQVVEGIDALFAERGVQDPHYRIQAKHVSVKTNYFGLSPNGHDLSGEVLYQLVDDDRFQELYRKGYDLVVQHQLSLDLNRHQFYLLRNRVR